MTTPKQYSPQDALLIDTLLGKKGIGDQLLAEHGTIAELAKMADALPISPARREKLRAAFAIHFLRDKPTAVCSPADAFNFVRDLCAESQEHFVVILLDTRNNIIARDNLYKGSLNTAMIRVGEVFRMAIVNHAASVIIAHNHPSGDPSPSSDDVALTKIIVEAGKMLDITVQDHIIIGESRFVSLKERALGF